MVYMELHLHWPQEGGAAQALLREALRLGYGGACLTRTALAGQPLPACRVSPAALHKQAQTLLAMPPLAAPPGAPPPAAACLVVGKGHGVGQGQVQQQGRPVFTVLSRLTAELSRPEQQFALNSVSGAAATYDVLAVKPCNVEAFKLCCTKVDCDVIVLDLSRRVKWHAQALRLSAAVAAACKRGLYFELSFASCLRNPKSKQHLLLTAQLLLRATKGRNVLLASGAAEPLQLRSPYDAGNLALFLGLTPDQARRAVAEAPGKVLWHARQRRNSSATTRLPKAVFVASPPAAAAALVGGGEGEEEEAAP